MRGTKRENFWMITEAIMGAQGHDVIGYLPRPNQAKMWSYQAMHMAVILLCILDIEVQLREQSNIVME